MRERRREPQGSDWILKVQNKQVISKQSKLVSKFNGKLEEVHDVILVLLHIY